MGKAAPGRRRATRPRCCRACRLSLARCRWCRGQSPRCRWQHPGHRRRHCNRPGLRSCCGHQPRSLTLALFKRRSAFMVMLQREGSAPRPPATGGICRHRTHAHPPDPRRPFPEVPPPDRCAPFFVEAFAPRLNNSNTAAFRSGEIAPMTIVRAALLSDGTNQTTKQYFADGAGAVISGVDRCALSGAGHAPRRPLGVAQVLGRRPTSEVARSSYRREQ
jgi:hypothetical protein